MDEKVAIKIDNVSKSFRLPHNKNSSIKSALVNFYRSKRTFETQEVLKKVSFEIKEGEFFAIVGRNGSGKSTLLKLLAGIYTPSEGSISVNGKLTPFIELGVGFNQELSGRENVFLNGALLGFSRKEMSMMYEDIVKFSELERFMDQKLKNYSSGMQVRLAFSIAIRAQSDILLLDEVLAVGDAAFQQKCFNYFEELKRNKKTVVFVTHDMSSVKRFCSKAVLIEGGKIKAFGSPDEIADQYTIDNLPTEKDEKNSNKNSKVKNLEISVPSNRNLAREDSIEINVKYELNKVFDVALGVSFVKDGISVAEMNSGEVVLGSSVGKTHKATFKAKLNPLNPGIYVVNVALFEKNNMEMITYEINCHQFIISGNDPKRGGFVYLEGEWVK